MKTNQAELEELIGKCFVELTSAYKEKYDNEKAERTAAMFLAAQIQLAGFIADIELKARHSKNEIDRVEAAKYFEIKSGNVEGKKMSEAALSQCVANAAEVIVVKRNNAEAESEIKKFNHLMNSLRDGHVFFRTMTKNEKAW